LPGLGSVGVELAVGEQVLNDLRIGAEGGEIHPWRISFWSVAL
jgi:hypothetical protein